jgi:hypothetical protein
MNKVVRDGKVAVIISPDYGAGWYSWNGNSAMLFDPGLVGLIEEGNKEKIQTYINLKWPEEYLNGHGLEVQWIPQGKKFRIVEYDGAESIQMLDQTDWLIA